MGQPETPSTSRKNVSVTLILLLLVSVAITLVFFVLWREWREYQNDKLREKYRIPTSDTINLKNGTVSIACNQDRDCSLVFPEHNYLVCDCKFEYCKPSVGSGRTAVNQASFESLLKGASGELAVPSCKANECSNYKPESTVKACSDIQYNLVPRCLLHRCVAI